MYNFKILIGTLYSGENEFEQCIQSIKEQTYTGWEHIVFRHLPKKEAHDALYREFMQRSDQFDMFIKLDADMVFNTNKALEIIVDIFSQDSDLDHVVMAVDDRFSDSLIMGLNIFSNRVSWVQKEENLFTDRRPEVFPGKKIKLWDSPAPLVLHSPNPSLFEAYHFGIHRALKTFQPNRTDFYPVRSILQWNILKNVWNHFINTDNRKLGFCILGAEHVIKNKVEPHKYDYTNRNLYEVFESYKHLQSSELRKDLSFYWSNIFLREIRYVMKTLPKRAKYFSLRVFNKLSKMLTCFI